MAALSLSAAGMVAMVFQGLILTAALVCGRLLKDMQWPFFRMNALASFLAALVVTAGGCLLQSPYPAVRARKWVLLRGVFGVSNFVLLVAAVRLGTSPGDVSSLASVNVVVAALLGRVFLGEALQWIHAVSLICCVTGVVLISQPRFLFSQAGDTEATPWLGYLLSITGGISAAGIAVASRKAGKTSIVWPTVSTCVLSIFVQVALPFTPLVEDFTLEPLLQHPASGVAWEGVLLFCTVGAIATSSAGNAWCPAAVSSTVGTASRMLWGYAAQIFVFGRSPEWLTICGAALMLVGVIAMTFARKPAPVSNKDNSLEQGSQDPAASPDDENESLASFAAVEFAMESPHETEPVRLRRPVVEQPAPQRLGCVATSTAPDTK